MTKLFNYLRFTIDSIHLKRSDYILNWIDNEGIPAKCALRESVKSREHRQQQSVILS